MTIDQKALEAAREAFTERVLPLGKQLERAIIAYIAALPASDHAGLRETMWGEVVFVGEDNAFLWKLDEEGNRDGEHYDRSIELSADTFPVGTKLVICEPDGEAATALSAASPAPLEGVTDEQVERAFKDGLAYGSNVEGADPETAWMQSRVRASLTKDQSNG